MRVFLLIAAAFMMMGAPPANAADAGIWQRPAVSAPANVYRIIPRSAEASLIRAGDACWRGCAQDCGRHFQVCLSVDTPVGCISQNDACDRYCQRQCRQYGGPLLPLD